MRGPGYANYRKSHTQMDDDRDLLEELDLGTPQRPRGDTLERPRMQGRPQAQFHIAYARDLTEADMEALASMPRGAPPRLLQRIHSSHHSLARCLAAGMKQNQAALVTGYSPVRISYLQRDPAFVALVADYRTEAKGAFADLAERMADMSLDAMEILQERLQDSPETFTIPVLLDLIRAFADRTGHGPGQDVNFKMSVDLIDRPPRETHEQWEARRARELEPGQEPSETNSVPTLNLKRLN